MQSKNIAQLLQNENCYSKIFNYKILKFKSKADFRQNTNKNQK